MRTSLVALVVVCGLGLLVGLFRPWRAPDTRGVMASAEARAAQRSTAHRRIPRLNQKKVGQPPLERAASERLGHLRGRILLPPAAGEDELDDLRVEAHDEERSVRAETDGATFQLRLPPGRYALTARAGSLVGAVEGAELHPGATTDVVVPLQTGATISGVLRVPGAIEVSFRVRAQASGSDRQAAEETGSADESSAEFEIGGLLPGERYDLVFSGDGLRETWVRGIVAPAQGLSVEGARGPALRGAIGLPPGTPCPFDTVTVEQGDEGETHADVDASCRFEANDLPPATTVVVRAIALGWHIEGRAEIPAQGDPEPMCLNPPCGDPPPLAQVAVELAGAPEHASFSLSASSADGRVESCGSTHGGCTLEDLAPGPARIEVTSRACADFEPLRVDLRPGENRLTVACKRLRTVQGLIRDASGAPFAPEDLSVRCAGAPPTHVERSFVFSLRCPHEGARLEYRTGPGDGWRASSPVPAATNGPAYVELVLP